MIIKIDKSRSERTSFPSDENLLREHHRFEELVADALTKLVRNSPSQVDKAITEALTAISLFFKVNYCGFLEVVEKSRQIRVLNMACGNKPQGPISGMDIVSIYPWAYDRAIEQGGPIVFLPPEKVPPAEDASRIGRETWRTLILCMLPLHIDGKVTHCIGLWSKAGAWNWPLVYANRLRLLGEVFAKVLIHKADIVALRKNEILLAEMQRIAHMGGWSWDVASGDLYLSDEVYRIFGLQPRAPGVTNETCLSFVHPDDKQAVLQAIDTSLTNPRKKYEIEHRLISADGSERMVQGRGEVIRDAAGKPVRMIGTIFDVTERKQTEARLQKALDEINRHEKQLEAENIYLRDEIGLGKGFANIVGASDPIQHVMFRIRQVAKMNTTVLLTGETGTGKGVFARALHDSGNRNCSPFVQVNCAGLPANLIESELFGRERGAFTGATEKQIGRFELANGGTIFLDEIGELPIDLQAKLLKVIESSEFERLGSPRTVKVDVRIIASTNRNLKDQIKNGHFRKDLFYRLNVFPIKIPPLRERTEDVPLLVQFFVDKFNKRCNKHITDIPRETIVALQAYGWPGNVRELMNVIERAVIISSGPVLLLADPIETSAHGSWEEVPVERKGKKMNGLAEMEREHILGMLRETGWKIEGPSGSAQALGMKPSTLRAHMKRLHITRPKKGDFLPSEFLGSPPS
jgi:formate hydrogenlyase transcriptional activator